MTFAEFAVLAIALPFGLIAFLAWLVDRNGGKSPLASNKGRKPHLPASRYAGKQHSD